MKPVTPGNALHSQVRPFQQRTMQVVGLPDFLCLKVFISAALVPAARKCARTCYSDFIQRSMVPCRPRCFMRRTSPATWGVVHSIDATPVD